MKRSDSDACRFTRPRSILKQETIDFPYDEGISSNESASDSENGDTAQDYFCAQKEPPFHKSDKKCVDSCDKNIDKIRKLCALSSTDDGTHTSDGDSSGGREVRSIIGNESSRRKYKEK